MCQQNSWRRRQGQPAFLRMFGPAKRRATTTAVARIATPGDVEMPRRLDGRPIGHPVHDKCARGLCPEGKHSMGMPPPVLI